MKIFSLEQIKESINISKDLEELINAQKAAFMDYSADLYDVPLPMQFVFPEQGSDCHIKGGYRQYSKHFVVKIAGSSKFGNNGEILVFDVESCELKVILQDKGFLTTLRTAIAGMIVLQLMPWTLQNIGIIGSGSLAGQLYKLAKAKYPKANILLYARNKIKAATIGDSVCDSVEDLVEKCDIVFTTTSSVEPIIYTIPESRNAAIIGLGSDDEHKSEIAPQLFKTIDTVIVDSKIQASKFGDISRALKEGIITKDTLMELGAALKSGISEDIKTIIADFSGIGAQDVAMAQFVLSKLVPG
jgi:ornithine cyclodeaminase